MITSSKSRNGRFKKHTKRSKDSKNSIRKRLSRARKRSLLVGKKL